MNSNQVYLELLQHLPDIVYEINTDGRFIFISNAISRWGFDPQELLGSHFSSIIHPEDLRDVRRDEVLARFQGRTTGPDGQPGLFDERRTGSRITRKLRVRLFTPDNHAAKSAEPVFEVVSLGLYEHGTDSSGPLMGSLGVMRDVNELKSREKALIQTEKYYRLLLENSSDIISILAHDGTILFKSDSIRRILGYDPVELIGENEYDFIAGEDRDVLACVMKRRLQSESGEMVEYRIRDSQGRWRVMESMVRRLRDGEGNIISSILNSRDLTERHVIQKALANSEMKYRAFYETALVGMITADIDTGTVLIANELGYTLFGSRSRLDFIGEVIDDRFASREARDAFRAELAAHGGVSNMEVQFIRVGGEVFWASFSARPDLIQGVMELVVADISRLKEHEEKIFRFNYYDQLTELPNRTLFTMFLEREIMKGRPFAVVGIGLDRFKHVNELYGAAAGDRLLCAIAKKLTGIYFQKDVVSRFEGDHFMILVAELDMHGPDVSIDNLHTIARKTLDLFSEPFRIDGISLSVTPSIGMSLFPADGGDAESLIANCESSIFVAKERGGNTSHYYDAGLNDMMMARFRLEKDLRSALSNREFLTFFQPRVDREARVTGLEALVRWNSTAQGRMIYPDEFIPLAEKSGLIMEIGRQVLRGACDCGCQWLEPDSRAVRIAVNLSPFQFSDPGLAPGIRDILRVTGLNPRLLELEITESSIMKNERESVRTLQELHDMGIALSIDDFGTGYSSLSKLRLYPVDLLKIDKSFVCDLPDDRQSAVLTRTIIDMAHNLGFGVVAEGVETKAQLEFLLELGCDHFQGFYFYRPMPPEEVCGVLG